LLASVKRKPRAIWARSVTFLAVVVVASAAAVAQVVVLSTSPIDRPVAYVLAAGL